MKVRIFLLSFLAALPFVLGSCAGDDKKETDRVNSIPWNRPEKWEGQGTLGGFTGSY